jgi:hypothetical protein
MVFAWFVGGTTPMGKDRLTNHQFHHRRFLSFSKEHSNTHAYKSTGTDLNGEMIIKTR